MTVRTRLPVSETLPPLTLPNAVGSRPQRADTLPRLRRLACAIAALMLPVLGVAVAETVHRAIAPKATQAAAPVTPSDGAAAPSGAVAPRRAQRTVRTAARAAESREVRS